MSVRFLADADLNYAVVQGLRLREPSIDFKTANDAGLERLSDPNYCQRVTANDGALGEQHLRNFQDNEKSIPTILTTSQKLSTGVDARNIRNIVLMRPINTMIEFKQIIYDFRESLPPFQ